MRVNGGLLGYQANPAANVANASLDFDELEKVKSEAVSLPGNQSSWLYPVDFRQDQLIAGRTFVVPKMAASSYSLTILQP